VAKKQSKQDSIAKIYSVLDHLFEEKFRPGLRRIEFDRDDIARVAKAIGVKGAANVPDLPYNFNCRRKSRSPAMTAAESKRKRWYIVPKKKGYAFVLDQMPIVPTPDFRITKIPDSTPEIIAARALTDEQAVLARIRYNRLIDIFLGITSYSLQSHIKSRVDDVQVEIDELYLGIRESGEQFVVAVEAKVEDPIPPYQIRNCFDWCSKAKKSAAKLAGLSRKVIGVSWEKKSGVIAMCELSLGNKRRVERIRERHYQLVPQSEITQDELARYRAEVANTT
jgi:hypothetical protein